MKNKGTKGIRPILFALLIGWTLVIGALSFWRVNSRHHETQEMAYIQARVALGKDMLYRRWNSNHGGVYVPVTEMTPPNPYLEHIPDRDITTTSGKNLTLVNPAYMTRQINEYEAEISDIRSHLISLKPVNPKNVPDLWEQKSLKSFETGAKEATVIDTLNGQPYFRLIQPFFVENACLKCHEQQGYKENDIRGGISISIPMKPLLTVEAGSKKHTILIYGFIWVLGIGGISLSYFKLDRSFQKQSEAEMAMRKAYREVEQKIVERTRDLNDEITERKILQETLTNSDQYNRMLFEQSAIGLALTSFDGRLVDINTTFSRIIGRSVEEAKALTYWDLTPVKYQAQEQKQLDSLTQTGHYGPYEKEFIHQDGHLVPVRLQGLIVERNNEKYVWSSVEDISEHKKAEEKIRESISLVRIATEKAKLGGWNVDLKENRCYWSDEVAAIHEMPPGDSPLVEDGINFYTPEWRERIIKVFTDCAVNGVPYDEEMMIFTSTGKRVWVRTIGEAVRDENGHIYKVEGAFQDISEKKMADEKSREKDLQFRKLSASVPDLIFQFTRKPDGSYCVPVASEGIKNIFGCSPEDVVDDFAPIAKVIFPEDSERVIHDIEYSAEHLTYFTCEFRVQIPGKPIQWIQSRSTPEKLPDGSITWYGFNADITYRKKAEQALLAKMDELERFQKLTVGREITMVELKKEVNNLLNKSGQDNKYKIVE